VEVNNAKKHAVCIIRDLYGADYMKNFQFPGWNFSLAVDGLKRGVEFE
jgi:hypothetical protein